MKTAETKKIYETACRVKRIVPNDDEGRTWHRVLREYEARDVEAALDAWWADTKPTQSGRPRGAFLPEPVELKPLVEAVQRKREIAAAAPKEYVAWECACGYRCSAFVTVRATRTVKCPRCKREMDEVHRSAA